MALFGGLLWIDHHFYAQRPKGIAFVCPCVPLVPLCGIFVNMLMLAGLGWQAWARVAGWTFVGIIIYLFYGVPRSSLRMPTYLCDEGASETVQRPSIVCVNSET